MSLLGSGWQRGGSRSARNVFLPIALLVALVMATLVGLLWLGAERQDRTAQAHSIELVRHIVNDTMDDLARQSKDYAWWNEAVRHLVLRLDSQWAHNNVGPYIYDNFGYEFSFVIGSDGRTLHATIDGEAVAADAFAVLQHGLESLVVATVEGSAPYEPKAATGLLTDGTFPVAVAVSIVLPEKEGDLDVPDRGFGAIAFGKRLDQGFWEALAQRHRLQDLEVLPAGAPEGLLPLRSADGTELGSLTWIPLRPGAAHLRSVLPVTGVATILVAAVTALVLQRATRTLQTSEERFRDVANATSDWIWETDARGRLTFLSDRFAAVTGLVPDAMLGRALPEAIGDPAGEAAAAPLSEVLAKREPFRNLLCRWRSPQGREHAIRVAGQPIVGPRDTLLGHRGTATDVTSEVEADQQMRRLALHDGLTDLPNRSALQERLRHAIQLARRQGGMAAVLCLDLDRFKDVNDTLGHAAGDLLVRQCAERLRGCLRENDMVARLGGDEFAVVQSGAVRAADVAALCNRIIERLAQPFDLDGSEVIVTASIGIALYPVDGEDPGVLLRHADIALYRAKEAGRNTFRFFEAGMDATLQARKSLERELRLALSEGGLEVHYQPQVATADGRLVGVEALLRWNHPARGPVAPDIFIPIAEESGLMLQLGEWVLRHACRQAVEWPEVVMSVNLSPVQFRQRQLAEVVRRVLVDTGLGPGRLELEITETVLLQETETALVTLQELRRLGVRIAMDDFGTGYSSLNHLQKFPFDKLKIDKSFIMNLDQRSDADAIVRAVVGLGRSLRIRTCAEGVETEEQVKFLRGEGCDELQGYYFSKPLPAEVIADLFGLGAAPRSTDGAGAEVAIAS